MPKSCQTGKFLKNFLNSLKINHIYLLAILPHYSTTVEFCGIITQLSTPLIFNSAKLRKYLIHNTLFFIFA